MTILPAPHDFSYVIVTSMKDECPYILDWISHHISIGFTHFVIMTNDCSDGTDRLCRNLEALGIVTHMNNKAPHPRGIQKTAWKRATRLKPIQEAEWLMALDVDEYFVIHTGNGKLDHLFAAFDQPPVALSFVWQIFGNNNVDFIIDQPVPEQFLRSSHPLQAQPYQIRGLKTLFRRKLFDEIGTHRPHGAKSAAIAGRHWVNADGSPIDTLFDHPYWCVWNSGFLFGTALGRIHHYPLRSKEAFMLKMIRGFVNRTGKGVRATQSPMDYWNMFDWNVYKEQKPSIPMRRLQNVKTELMREPKIQRLHQKGVMIHQDNARTVFYDYPEFKDAFEEIKHMEPRTVLDADDPIFIDPTKPPSSNSILTFFPGALKRLAESSTLVSKAFVNNYYDELTKSIEAN